MKGFSFNRILAIAGVIALLTALVASAAVLKLRQDALEEAGHEVSGLSEMLAEQVRQSALNIDLALNEAAAVLDARDETEFQALARTEAVGHALSAIADRRSAIEQISIENSDGATVASSRGAPPQDSGPIYDGFDWLKNNRPAQYTPVGALRVSEATGALVVDFMRRIETADGRFLGVVRASVGPRALVSTYSLISSMPGRSYALFKRDGSIFARYPAAITSIGERLPTTSPWYRVVEQGGGVYETVSSFDNRDRIISVRPLPFSQLVVTVSVSREMALARWREQALAVGITAGLALAIAAFLAQALMVQFGKIAEKEIALRSQSIALKLSNQRFATALENMSQGLVVFDRAGRVVISNARYATIYGLDPAQIRPGTPARKILEMRVARGLFAGADAASYLRDAMGRPFTDRRVDLLSDGRSILVNHAACADGGLVVTHEDITEREEANSRIAHMAMHDELTQVANRALFLSSLETLRKNIGTSYAYIVVMLIDLDEFKPVNDTFGHAVGDHVLKECARRIGEAAPHAQVVARLGGDEFALAYGVRESTVDDPAGVAARAIAAISEPYLFQGQNPTIGACIGVAVVDERELSVDDMLRRADLALYAAKGERANCFRLFEPRMELDAVTRRELAIDLAKAIETDELHLVYQPVVDVRTFEIRHMEALLRWRHPRRGLVPPQEFVRLAEETRQIEQLGAWALRRACADAASWPEHVGVAVNVSPLQIAAADFVSSVAVALEQAGLPARRLELEITENALLQDKGEIIAALHRLRERGVAIALDDFGTGFASLSYLKTFPFDRLKIDRSFVADGSRDAGSAAIIAATVQLARAFDIEVTGEGVETPEQLATLRAAGVQSVQGYLFGWPDTVENGLPVIAERQGVAASRVA